VTIRRSTVIDWLLPSGVTTGPADPAMREARGPMEARKYGINAKRGFAIARRPSVRLSIRLSVTLVD